MQRLLSISACEVKRKVQLKAQSKENQVYVVGDVTAHVKFKVSLAG